MPHPKHRKHDTRRRILSAAARLFAEHGFEATSIEQVMQACGLTRGGFYLHFRSKAALHAEALAHAAPAAGRPQEWLDALFETAGQSAPWASLALDVGSQTPEVRQGYARTLAQVRDRLRDELAGRNEAALAVTAMLVGALAVARTVDDAALRSMLASACRDAAQALRRAGTPEEPAFFWAAGEGTARPSGTLH
jgi:TetR/AcrR family transcriptional regulator, transcriptional repressor for nem operon